MNIAILQGMAFWSGLVFLLLSTLSIVIYCVLRVKKQKPKMAFLPFLAYLIGFSILAGSLTFLGMYLSKQYGLEREYKIGIRIFIAALLVFSFLKTYFKGYFSKK